ncbi:hypothetical protein LP316_00475 [Thalassotalea sp. LPB0316]|uniref:hypothetical protein n=1 Tax=Thalassotalea sp. LPB0316 TaxID=2769490 RepID=UPI0018677E80|nr:hypothetical protein [Thalassotalea sp. LPB0316]QOL25835.1 hypothetical protein LP316_00475 [Thalassotalea sp. LPB0316]
MLKLVFTTILILFCYETHAVCFDPKTWISGYKIPLEQEIEESKAIIIGEVIKEERIHDIPNDPEFYSAIHFTIRVEQTLKGDIEDEIMIKETLDSSRYGLSLNEKHILFLYPDKYDENFDYSVTSCGNSSLLPEGEGVVNSILTHLKSK